MNPDFRHQPFPFHFRIPQFPAVPIPDIKHVFRTATILLATGFLALFSAGCALSKPSLRTQRQIEFTNHALKAASEAVVLIISTDTDHCLLKFSEAANGIIISRDGYILTVSHGLSGSTPEVYIGDDRYPAKVVYNNCTFDFAILKVDVPHALPFVQFANENSIYEHVFLIGKRKRTREIFMSTGIVNAKGINVSSKEISWIKTHISEKRKVDYAVHNGILHSAQFFIGLSGCPLLNEYGKVIGINTGLIGKERQRITLALELICFLPIIEKVTHTGSHDEHTRICDLDINLKDPIERISWIMNGLAYYCSLLGKDTEKLHEVRMQIEKEAQRKITQNHVTPKKAIQWAWKTFLSETYHLSDNSN